MQITLRSCLVVIFVALLATPAMAREGIDWTSTSPASGQVVGHEVRVEEAGTHHLLTIAAPDIRGSSYSVDGSVRFENVGGAGYLEMWSFFADGSSYYSRTLADQGPMAALSGSSRGRSFELLFELNGSPPPERIEINVVLPEGGTVWVGPLGLTGFGASTDWWTDRQSGMIGAIGGTLAGLFGAIVGILAGRRRRRRLVQAIMVGGVGLGALLIIVALVAVLANQPAHVWYPIGLLGLILAGVNGLLIPRVRRSYAEVELQRMRALDA